MTVTNTSPGTWLATGTSAVKLAYHWLDANGNVTMWEGLRTPLPLDVLPGTTTVVSANVQAPPSRGTYTLRFDLIREGQTWFSAKGVAGADVQVAVGSGLGASYATPAGSATLVTTAPAPTCAPFPTVIPGRITAPSPTSQPSSSTTGAN